MADSHTFTVTLSAAKQAALRKAATAQGIIATQHGEIAHMGVKVAYAIDPNYHPGDGSTQVTFIILHKPFLLSEHLIESEIESYIDTLPTEPPPGSSHVVVGTPGKSPEPVSEPPEGVAATSTAPAATEFKDESGAQNQDQGPDVEPDHGQPEPDNAPEPKAQEDADGSDPEVVTE